jgi:U3 small nucleolar RNA-associated protein 21
MFWDFASGQILHKWKTDDAVPTGLRYNSGSGLLAVSFDDLCLRVMDVDTRKTVRELWGCVGQIYDFCFSHDGRWLVACSMDSIIRIFDLPTGHLIDAFKTTTCTNVTFSSTGEFLATTHAGSAGIHVWTNKALLMHVPTKQIDETTGVIDLTEGAEFRAASQLVVGHEQEEDETPDGPDSTEMDQLDQSLLTLSLVPRSRWQTLLNLEGIRQRNRPIQPPERPKAAPFFLGSSLINSTKGDDQIEDDKVDDVERTRISRLAMTTPTGSTSQLTVLLDEFEADPRHDPSALSGHLTLLAPSATDLEIRSLTLHEMPSFVRALTEQLRSKTAFELVNTWMSVFLRLHGDFVGEVEELHDAVLAWRAVMQAEERRLARLVGYTRGVVDFLRSAR